MHSLPTVQLSDVAVAERYSAAAQQREAALCCPVDYDSNLLSLLPAEIIEKDYGCGDPSAFVQPGDCVLDLGSGGGKLCYMAAQIVGQQGRVIGVDTNQSMLQLARKYQSEMATRLGYDIVEFRYGRIEDLALDLDKFQKQLQAIDATAPDASVSVMDLMRRLRRQEPMIADASVDCVISNCVLNLVDPESRTQLLNEIFRVLRPGGRAAISDIVSDEDVPLEMQRDEHLWSGCVSGAWREDLFCEAFVQAGFDGVRIAKYQREPWQTIQGIEFRSATVLAYKPDEGRGLDRKQAVIYQGPFSQVQDDQGNVYRRGQRMAVSDRLFAKLTQAPYREMFIAVQPFQTVPENQAAPFVHPQLPQRSPRETKGDQYCKTQTSDAGVCQPGSGCC